MNIRILDIPIIGRRIQPHYQIHVSHNFVDTISSSINTYGQDGYPLDVILSGQRVTPNLELYENKISIEPYTLHKHKGTTVVSIPTEKPDCPDNSIPKPRKWPRNWHAENL